MKRHIQCVRSENAGSSIRVRIVLADESQWFDGLLDQHHYLARGQPVGDYLRQVVEVEQRPVALLVWGPACYSIKDRDLWISWSANQRLERLKLIVQNRRFLVLAKKGECPNLASQAMGAALQALPEHWRQQFGYRPLLAESFTDPEAYEGTCYKASNWEPVGLSAGYSRHRADFYIANERPKKLWLRPLVSDAKKLLRAVEVPPECRPGLVAAASGTLPLEAQQMDCLLDVFRKGPDPRDCNTRYRIGPVLTLIAMALLAGKREIAQIARFATTLSQPQRRRLSLPRKKGTKAFYQVPGYGVFYQVLTRMDPEAFAKLLSHWLQNQAGRLPQALALDGKMIRDHIGLLTLAQHEDGAPQAIRIYDQKEGTERCELTAAAQLLKELPALDGKLITADPLHCQREHAREIVEKGGDYLAQIKANQPNLFQYAQRLDQLKNTPFLPRPNAATDASRSAACIPSPSNRSPSTSPSPER